MGLCGERHTWPFYRRKIPSTHCTGGWVDLGPNWVSSENLASTWVQTLDPPVHNKSLYQEATLAAIIKGGWKYLQLYDLWWPTPDGTPASVWGHGAYHPSWKIQAHHNMLHMASSFSGLGPAVGSWKHGLSFPSQCRISWPTEQSLAFQGLCTTQLFTYLITWRQREL